MREVLFSLTFLFSFSLFSQRLTLSVKADDKITMHGFCYWQELEVRSKDTSFVAHLHHGNPDMVKNLKAGSYQLTAVSLFGHRVTKKFALSKKTAAATLKGLQKFYTRVPETTCLSEKLKLNDTLFVLYNSSADEHVKEKIAVTKTKAGYKAIQYKGISNEVFQEMQFKDASYAVVTKFEKDGKKANSPKAETAPQAEIYTIELNKEIVSFIVPGKWGGIDNLKSALFLVEQK